MATSQTASAKDAVIEMIRQMPDGVTVADIVSAVADQFGPQIENEEAFLAELDRRRNEHLTGKDPGVPAEEFIRQLRAERSR